MPSARMGKQPTHQLHVNSSRASYVDHGNRLRNSFRSPLKSGESLFAEMYAFQLSPDPRQLLFAIRSPPLPCCLPCCTPSMLTLPARRCRQPTFQLLCPSTQTDHISSTRIFHWRL